jgi:hypothetical protein
MEEERCGVADGARISLLIAFLRIALFIGIIPPTPG